MTWKTSAQQLDPSKCPRHVAIIMDGNGRWAKARGLPRLAGHRAGAESVRAVVRAAATCGVSTLTLYAFSTENWARPASEVRGLMRLLVMSLKREVRALDAHGVRLKAVGRLEALPADVRRQLQRCEAELESHRRLTLVLALNYGGRQDILDAVNRLRALGKGPVTEEMLAAHLSTAGMPDPDLMIRTSGEHRLSNFLLWQSAYAEMYFTPIFWPDFREPQFVDALKDFQSRHRRFGGL